MSKSQVDDIVLVGGSTRIPKVQKVYLVIFLMVKNYVKVLIQMKQ